MKLRCLILLLLLCLTACAPTSGEPLPYIGQSDHHLPGEANQLLQLTQEGGNVTIFRCDCASGERQALFSVECEPGRCSVATGGNAIWLATAAEGTVRIHDGHGEVRNTDIPCLDRPLWFAWYNGALLLDVEEYAPDTGLFTRRIVAYDWEADSWQTIFSAQRYGGGLFRDRGYTRAALAGNDLYVSDPESGTTLRIDLMNGTQEAAAEVCLLSPYVWGGILYGFCAADGIEIPDATHQQPVEPAVALVGFDCATGARVETGVMIPWAPLQNGGVTYDGGSVYLIPDKGSTDKPWAEISRYDLQGGKMEELTVTFPTDGRAYVDFSDLAVCGGYLAFCFGQGEQSKLSVYIADRAVGWAVVPLEGGTARTFNAP